MLEYLVREYLVWGLGIFSPPYLRMIFQEKCSSTYILLTNQISLSDYLYILSWGICALLLFVSQTVCFSTCQGKNSNIFRTKRDFKVN